MLQPEKLALVTTGIMDETVALVMVVKHPYKKIPILRCRCTKKRPIFIPMNITENVVESVTWKLLVV